MINRGHQPAPDEQPGLIEQIATEAGVTPGELMGRPEVAGNPESDLLALARQHLPESAPELMSERVADAIENAPFTEWADISRNEPRLLINAYAVEIKERLGTGLKASDLAEWWNDELSDWFNKIERKTGAEAVAVVNYLGLVFSELLNQCMTEEDNIVLDMPDQRALFSDMGWRLRCGRLEVNGNVENDFGAQVGGTAKLVLNGDAGNFVGEGAHGAAEINVNGNAQDYVGLNACDIALIIVKGQVTEGYGQGLSGGVRLEVGGVKPGLHPSGVAERYFLGQVIVDGEIVEMPRYP